MSFSPEYEAVSKSTSELVNAISVDVADYSVKFRDEDLITETVYNTVIDTRIKQDDAGRARDIVQSITAKVKADPEAVFCKLLKVLRDVRLNSLAESIEKKFGERVIMKKRLHDKEYIAADDVDYKEPQPKQLRQQQGHNRFNAPSAAELHVLTPAIANYAAYLKAYYRSHSIAPVKSWPPTPCKKYINLAVVNQSMKCREEYIGHILKGNIQEALGDRQLITIDKIFEGEENKFVVIEGAPGMGKSTLAWELCRKWEDFASMKKYSLVILLRLREARVQKMTCYSEIFSQIKNLAALKDDMEISFGKGVLFILDGFDELPVSLQQEGFFIDLIDKNVLPECSIVVTTRPSASATLITHISSLVYSHMEILGFTQERIEEYAATVFSSDPEMLLTFKTATSFLENPAVNSLMYVPINAVIIVQIFKEKKKLPLTLTELYTEICLSIYNNYSSKVHNCRVRKLENLPDQHYKDFLELSKVAFEAFSNEQLTFDTLPDINHFGFLNSVSSLYGGEEKSFNFLHLTIQEFFAAYYISHLPDHGVELFKTYSGRWNVVWRFVAGLTKFHILETHKTAFAFQRFGWLTEFFILCVFESQTVIDFSSIFEDNSQYWSNGTSFGTDYFFCFELGYCIACCSSAQSYWNLRFTSVNQYWFTMFMKGLSSNKSHTCGEIRSLLICSDMTSIASVFPKMLDHLKIGESPLNKIAQLSITINSLDKFLSSTLMSIISYLTNLKKINLTFLRSCSDVAFYIELFQLLQRTAVQSLDISGTGIENLFVHSPSLISDFKSLIHPSSGKLQELFIGRQYLMGNVNKDCIKQFIPLITFPCALQKLSLATPLYWSCLSDLFTSASECNHQIKELEFIFQYPVVFEPQLKSISAEYYPSDSLPSIVNILKNSSSVRHLTLVNAPSNILSDTRLLSALQTSTIKTLQFCSRNFMTGVAVYENDLKEHILHVCDGISCEIVCIGKFYLEEKYLSSSHSIPLQKYLDSQSL